jgi:hypothetical protein
MGGLAPFAVRRAWISWALWTAGAGLRWFTNVTGWNWRVVLPASAAFELFGFLLFFATVSRHKAAPSTARKPIETWMKLVMASTAAFLLALLANLTVAIVLASTAAGPDIPHWLDQRFLFLAAWGFPVLAVWGFNARWLPIFLGLRAPLGRQLLIAMSAVLIGIAAALTGHFPLATLLLFSASVFATDALNVFRPSEKPAKTLGVSALFPFFVRTAYVWLLISAVLGMCAPFLDSSGGVWGASRHALTVGFLSTMVFAIGQRVLPAFCGMRVLFSSRLMGISLIALNVGCALRVFSEIPAYEANIHAAWAILPVSAVTELTAVTLFVVNMAITLLLPPPAPAIPPPVTLRVPTRA